MRKVTVEPYNTNWVKKFNEEKSLLNHIFGDDLVDVHHIGSTSVEGLHAKPIIDIMPVVKDINQVDQYNKSMKEIGYEPKGEYGISGRRFFQKGGDERSHHVHIFEYGSFDIERHLAFRDYLREHSDKAAQYGELKSQLSRQYSHDMDAYINGKNQLVKDIERKAIMWYRQ